MRWRASAKRRSPPDAKNSIPSRSSSIGCWPRSGGCSTPDNHDLGPPKKRPRLDCAPGRGAANPARAGIDTEAISNFPDVNPVTPKLARRALILLSVAYASRPGYEATAVDHARGAPGEG